MIEIPPVIMESLWALILALVAAVIAYLEKMKKDEIVAYMDPTDTEVLAAPEGVPAVTYVMNPATKSKILAGLSGPDLQNVLNQIETAEKERLATYTITYSDGSFDIEYGYVANETVNANVLIAAVADATRPPNKVDEETFRWLMAGLPESEAASVRAQVDAAEAKGLRQFTVTTSRWVYIIDNGMLAGSKGP